MRALVAAMLVASGAAALLHEAAWFRLLVPVLGAGALPGAIVTAGALLGMAAGSVVGGRLADGVARPGVLLAAAEAVAAVVGGLAAATLPALEPLARTPALASATALLALAAAPWGVAIPATVAMVRWSGPGLGRTFGRLYAWNTLGAVLGIVAAATFLFEALGNRATVTLACGLEAAVALAALTLARRPSPSSAPAPTEDEAPPTRARLPARLLLASALCGAAGVGAQVVWTRRLTPILGATFQVFALVLALQLVGIALASAWLAPRDGRARPGVGWLAALSAALTAGTPWLLGGVVETARERWWHVYGDPFAMLGLRAAIAAVLVLPGVLTGAAILPWLVEAGGAGVRRGGRTSGALIGANATGCAVGGLATALFAIPRVGTAGALVLCSALLALAGALGTGARARLALLALTATLVGWIGLRPPHDAAATSCVGALYSVDAWRPDDVTTRLARDGVTASVLVRDREGRREFWVEGSYEASTGPTDRLHLGLLGALPLALHAARTDRPARVALIGLGGGLSAQAAARFAPRRLDVFELEPEVASAAELFRDVGGGLPVGATLALLDGRRAILRGGDADLDVISSDPVHPAVAGSAFLYTSDFWRGAARRLTAEGLLVQWLPLYQLGRDELALALRTFAASLPHPYVFVAGPDAILVGAREPLRLDAARLDRVLASEAGSDLRTLGFTSAGRLLGLLALDRAGIGRLVGPGEVDTDDRLLLELRAGRHEAGDTAAALAWITSAPADPRRLLDAEPTASFEDGLVGAARFARALGAWVRGDYEAAAGHFRSLTEYEPTNVLARRMADEAMARAAIAMAEFGVVTSAATLARELLRREGVEPTLRLDAAEVLARSGATSEAAEIARPYAERYAWPRARRLAGMSGFSPR